MAVSLVYFKPAGKILDPKEGSELLRNDSGRDSQIAHYLRAFKLPGKILDPKTGSEDTYLLF